MRLSQRLQAAAPPGLEVSTVLGIYVSPTTYYIPDIMVVPSAAVDADRDGIPDVFEPDSAEG